MGLQPLETERLVLTPLSLELVDALSDRPAAERLLGARIPDGFPDAELGGFLPLYERALRADPSQLGYGTEPDRRNRGYASEAAAALVAWGLQQPEVEKVVSRCDPGNAASIRVLEKTGLRRCGEADGMLAWELLASPRD